MASKAGGKNRGASRQAAKNYRRAIRKGSKPDLKKGWRQPPGKVPRWMRGKPMMKFGMGGTDKSHRGGRKIGHGAVYYSDKPAKRD